MKTRLIHIVFFWGWAFSMGFAQLSPGDLTEAHAEYEGLSNCTLCHDLGDKVTNEKCLDCHKEIRALIDNDRGYHSYKTVANKNCIECHSEHHGRKFNMARIDEDNFDHLMTGYALDGKHVVIDCRKCHTSENIEDPDIRKRKKTFLGLQQDCIACHTDFHQETLSDDCASCHNSESFRPAPYFDHAKAKFELREKHLKVECKSCHPVTTRNGREFQEFTGIPFNDCVACHDDAHEGRLPGKCMQCHTEQSFDAFTGRGKFDHNPTGFSLNGKHRSLSCFTCHAATGNPLTVFSGKEHIEEKNCAACHDDPHQGKLGNSCVDCHNETGFVNIGEIAAFNHGVTDFPLEGKHAGVDCRQCHTAEAGYDIDFSRCSNCHDDFHKGEFVAHDPQSDCADCHTVKLGFEETTFSFEEHDQTVFPLEGAHMATPCFACHMQDEQWSFTDMGTNCIDCHNDLHKGYLPERYYPENRCKNCHDEGSWQDVKFDHSKTSWPLTGRHLETTCSKCHFDVSADGKIINQNFTALSIQCAGCHEDAHEGMFAENGSTDCQRCHITGSWSPDNFNHNATRFPLEGKHEGLECDACHKPVRRNGKNIINFKLEKFECKDCHS